ncbi:MAG: hypothetical protein QXV17_04655 [Candidatus Micrarchaeaceae archaeon]
MTLLTDVLDSPLMYIVVGVVLTEYTKWEIKRTIRKLQKDKTFEKWLMKLMKAYLESKK